MLRTPEKTRAGTPYRFCDPLTLRKRQKFGGRQLKAADITATVSDIDEDTEIFGKIFVFTGTLQRMNRKRAMQAVVNMGGCCADRVTQTTDYLVLGNNDYRNSTAGRKTSKHAKAEHYLFKMPSGASAFVPLTRRRMAMRNGKPKTAERLKTLKAALLW